MILILVFVLLTILILSYNKKEQYHQFLSKEETSSFFKEDRDNYLKKLTPIDIKAQRSHSKSDYQQKIMHSATDFTPLQKKIIVEATHEADSILRTIYMKGFDGKKAEKIKWKIALTKGNMYEDGLPHTRLDTIFISNALFELPYKQIVRTMLHEKVHVYERLFPEDMKEWIQDNGFTPYKKWSTFKTARSNPDIDEWAYLSPDGKPMIVEYRSKEPKNIHDVVYPDGHSYKTEHPNEVLAYRLETYIN